MRKYLFSGLLIIVICLAGVTFWELRPLTKAAEITPNELANWVQDTDNAVFEATNEYFYIQEAIGSTGVILQNPYKVSNDFNLNFQVMSLTKTADLSFILKKENHTYNIALKIENGESKIVLYKDNLQMLEKSGVQIKPDIYYNFSLIGKNGKIGFAINEDEVVNMQIDKFPFDLAIELTGEPDNPAAIQITNMQISNKQ